MPTSARAALLLVLIALGGCGGKEPGAKPDPNAPHADQASLVDLVQTRGYAGWERSGPRMSAGAHGGTIRVHFNPVLAASIRAGASSHPAGSSAVKELLRADGSVAGHAVMFRDATDGWIWLEGFGPDYRGASYFRGESNFCASCHSQGTAFIRSPLP